RRWAQGARCWVGMAALSLGLGAAGCTGDLESEPQYDCSLEGRKAFVANVMSDYYLWYDRVPAVDIDAMSSPEELMRAMTFSELDHWSGMQRQAERAAFFDQGRFQGMGYTLGRDRDGG